MVHLRGTPVATSALSATKGGSNRARARFRLRDRPNNGNGILSKDGASSTPPPDPLNPSFLEGDRYRSSVTQLTEWISSKRAVLCLTGAGLSTESGIPDYRGHRGSYFRTDHKPMIHDEFVRSERSRRRYWGRSLLGWKEFSQAQPNSGHLALTQLESMGKIGVDIGPNNNDRVSIITQNVDGLHAKAGSRHVLNLHGRNDRVVCMEEGCGAVHDRGDFQHQLEERNPDVLEEIRSLASASASESQKRDEDTEAARPDGDAEVSQSFRSLADSLYQRLELPTCPCCGVGFVKPDVTFFGGSVPLSTVEHCRRAVDACDGLLCVGTSLEVHSAHRFVVQAATAGVPVGILNVGPTRAEREWHRYGRESDGALVKFEAPTGVTLEDCVRRLAA